jgi:hypothetical protein
MELFYFTNLKANAAELNTIKKTKLQFKTIPTDLPTNYQSKKLF